jgi:signal-transduction protein with cAMP-binding, CBS, and nucleotidyltransferase domain
VPQHLLPEPEHPGPGIITERDLMLSIGAGESPDAELVEAHMASDVIFASPDWSLDDAAEAMVNHGFRHLVVVSGGDVAGMLSMRDLVRCYVEIASAAAAVGASVAASES